MAAASMKIAWVRAIGAGGVWALLRHRLFGHSSAFLAQHGHLFHGHGLELGGPSALFGPGAYAPVYALVDGLDNVNFAAATRWEGSIAAGRTFRFRADAPPGLQFVHEATDLASIASESYDFVVSSHMLEHSANPLKALREWQRVMKPGATLLLVLPHKDGTFDRHRPTTPVAHMIEDFRRGTGEDDTTHFEEVLRLHDLQRDIWQPSAESFKAWVLGNAVNRGVHHHVFDSLSAAQLVDAVGFEILGVEPAELESVFVFARKPVPAALPDNARFTTAAAPYLRASPFASDRHVAA